VRMAATSTDTMTIIKNALYSQWPSITTSFLSIGFLSWAIATLRQLPYEQVKWNELLISNLIPILIYLSFGTLFMIVAAFLLLSTTDNERAYSIVTICIITIGFALSTAALAINNYTNTAYDNLAAFNAAANPIIVYSLIGSICMIATSSIFFITYANQTPVMNFSIFVSSIAIILSIVSTGITRISRF
jgi:hypothetical protein